MPLNKKDTVIDIVWFKKDLRTLDNKSLEFASNSGNPILFIYIIEPSVTDSPDFDKRHSRFIYESLIDVENRLREFSLDLNYINCEALEFFEEISKKYNINNVLSYQEIGNNLTYSRDKIIANFFHSNNINWIQNKTNGIIRGLKSRKNWKKKWIDEMKSEIVISDLDSINKQKVKIPSTIKLLNLRYIAKKKFQPGGETYAWMYVKSFLKSRHIGYTKNISRPKESRISCSRLSPYLAYGNLSSRQIYQFFNRSTKNRDITNFLSRLQWRCHFMQKFDDEPEMEFKNINKAYDTIRNNYDENLLIKWKEGTTGIPIIDACMRCLDQTGYLNFRMRAMIVSFAAFNLWQDWKNFSHHLAKKFLDYEPGIHYSQIQMQSAVTGINTVRIYNPVKNSIDLDPKGEFIKKWLPELSNIPAENIHQPWKMTLIEQQMYDFQIGKDYPNPIVDIDLSRKEASNKIWEIKKTAKSKYFGKKILNKHVNS
jgi:deoxyribodipyrimidine photo-lyase